MKDEDEVEGSNQTVSRFFRLRHNKRRARTAIRPSSCHQGRQQQIALSSFSDSSAITIRRRKQSSSRYFWRSPSSAWGAAQEQQRVGEHLLPTSTSHHRDFCEKFIDHCKSRTNNERETIVLRHFGSCPFFRERWARFVQSSSSSASDSGANMLEQRLDHAVRHLCSCKCYLRAFAPCRDFWSLRQAVTAALDDEQSVRSTISVDACLRGWRCFLLPPDEMESLMMMQSTAETSSLPRTIFVDPEGNQFSSASKVLQHLRKKQHLVNVAPAKSIEERESSSSLVVITPTRETNAASPSDNKSCSVEAAALSSSASTTADRPNLVFCTNTPFGLLEELFVDDPWRLLLSTIFLNRTSRVQVDAILHEFLSRWPTAQSVVNDNVNEESLAAMSHLLQPMGMRNRRAAGIVRFSREYLELLATKQESANAGAAAAAFALTRSDILGLYYCGEYAYAAYQIFIQRHYSQMDPPDHALRVYVEYQRGRYCDVLSQHKQERHPAS